MTDRFRRLALGTIFFFATTLLAQAASTHTLYLNRSWIDGVYMTDRCYVKAEGAADFGIQSLPISAATTFVADVQKGHEVNAWSYGKLADSTKAYNLGHFTTIVSNGVDRYTYTPSGTDAMCLACHQDWLLYTIEFDRNGGDGTMPALEKCVYNQSVTLPATTFTRKGYTFKGWALSSSGPALSATTVKGEDFADLDHQHKTVKLYALWQVNTCAVTFDANGGAYPDGTTTRRIDETYGEVYVLPSDAPTRGGYTFANAWTNAAGHEVKSGTILNTDANHTLYAKWNALPAMRVNAIKVADEDGADGSATGGGLFTWGENCYLQATKSTGSTFAGWTKNATTGPYVSTEPNYTVVVTEAADYYAHFRLESYKITFRYKDANGNDAVDEQMVKYNHNAVPPTVPDWGRNTFKAWSSDKYLSVKGEAIINATYAEHATVGFDSNDGRSLTFDPITVVIGEAYGPLPVPLAREMYDFIGWKAPDGEIVTKTSPVSVRGDHTLVAQWKTEPFWVSLDANGGSVSPSQIQVTYDQPYPALPAPTWEGYQFLGWFTSKMGGEEVKEGYRVQLKRYDALYAHWKAEEHTVTFDAAGGEASETSRVLTYGTTYGTLPTATRAGYTFDGWFKADKTRVWSSTTFRERADLTLTAQWTAKTHYVRFDSNGGFGYMSDESFVYDQEKALTANAFTRTGYTFVGWGKSASAETSAFADGETVKNLAESGTVDLYALWRANTYTIAFDRNGGLGEMVPVSATYDEDVTLPPCTMTWGSNTFRGWLLGGKTYKDGETVRNLTATAGATVTLLAQWSDDYAIVFNGNGATAGEMAQQSIAVNEYAYLSPNAYEKTGYTFGGWATSVTAAAEKKPAYADGARVRGLGTTGGTVNLYAVWSNNTYTVRFFPNGGEGAPRDQQLTYDVPTALASVPFKRENQAFKGWTLDPATETIACTNCATVTNLTMTANAIVPLYAKWERIDVVDSALSRAADCDTTVANDHVSLLLTTNSIALCTIAPEGAPGGNDESLKLQPQVDRQTVELYATIKGKGRFSFLYKVISQYDEDLYLSVLHGQTEVMTLNPAKTTDGWQTCTYEKTTEDQEVITWIVKTSYPPDMDYVLIDRVKWLPDVSDAATVGVTFRVNDGTAAPADIMTNVTYAAGRPYGTLPTPVRTGRDFLGWSTTGAVTTPDVTAVTIVPAQDVQLYAVWKAGANPEPTEEDRPVIGADFSFATDERFNYVIKMTDTLESPIAWTVRETVTGDGKAVTLPIQEDVENGLPQRFYKVEVIQRK